MNECKRCGNQSEVLYDIHGVLVCIHCAVANGVKARTLDEVIAENEQQAARIQELESRLARATDLLANARQMRFGIMSIEPSEYLELRELLEM